MFDIKALFTGRPTGRADGVINENAAVKTAAISSFARGNNPNPLRSFAIFLEKHPTGLLASGAFAPYKRFATGKT
ncbi:MAG: hypothetical protein ACLTYN_03625 [Dysosmobacter welbionis]